MTRHIEDDQQIAVVTWFRTAQRYKKIPAHYLLVHSNNSTQGLDSYAKRSYWGRRGGIAGIPDLVLYVATSEAHALFIEMKAESHRPKRDVDKNWWLYLAPGTNGKEVTKYGVSYTQSNIMFNLHLMGYKCVVCYGCNDAVQTIQDYMGVKF